MNHSFFRTTLLLIALTLTGAAFGATKRPPPDVALERNRNIDLVIPSSQIGLDQYAVPRDRSKVRNFEINASSWSPNDLGWSSQVLNTGSFHTNGAQVSFNYSTPVWELKNLTVSPKVGLSYAQLARSGTLDVLGHQNAVKQTMNLYAVRVGAELTPKTDFKGHLQPFLDAALLPYLGQLAESDYGDSEERTGFAVEGIAGVAWRSPGLASWVNAQNLGFEIGIQGTQGLGSNLTGIGVIAGSRLEL